MKFIEVQNISTNYIVDKMIENGQTINSLFYLICAVYLFKDISCLWIFLTCIAVKKRRNKMKMPFTKKTTKKKEFDEKCGIL